MKSAGAKEEVAFLKMYTNWQKKEGGVVTHLVSLKITLLLQPRGLPLGTVFVQIFLFLCQFRCGI